MGECARKDTANVMFWTKYRDVYLGEFIIM